MQTGNRSSSLIRRVQFALDYNGKAIAKNVRISLCPVLISAEMQSTLAFLKSWLPPPSILALLLLCGVLTGYPEATEYLRYDRSAVNSGQWWRLLSANLVHNNFWHFALNLGSVWIQAVLFRDLLASKVWLLISLVCAFCNVLGLHLFSADIQWYVGMSGALYGIALFGSFALIRNREWLVGGILASYLTGRIVYEHLFTLPDELENLIGVTVAIDAHLWGLLTAYAMLPILLTRWSKKLMTTKQDSSEA